MEKFRRVTYLVLVVALIQSSELTSEYDCESYGCDLNYQPVCGADSIKLH